MFILKYISISIAIISHVIAQNADTTELSTDNREMFTSVDISYSKDEGNTNYKSLYYGFDFSILGNVGPLKDTEFSINYSKTDDVFDGELFANDQYLTSKFDLWANQRLSPFLFFQASYDSLIGLNQRINFGLGAKAEVFGPLSLSYALLWESEDYKKFDVTSYDSLNYEWYDYTDSVFVGLYDYDSTLIDPDDFDGDYYYYYYYGNWDVIWPSINADGDSILQFYRYDSTLTDGYFYYTDSVRNENGDFYYYSDSTTESTGGVEKFYRHSIRPKFKIKLFDESLVFDYRLFYKPRVDDWEDYLLEHSLQISVATFYDALTLNFNYSDKYNSRYDLKTNGGIRFINPETGVLFKERDSSINIGFSFMF